MNRVLARVLNLPGISALRSVIDRQMVDTASALYAQNIIGYLLPLIMIPYLARVLGPETWGVVVFIQGIGMYLLIVVDYSFEMSATREIARRQEEPSRLGALVAGVMGARVLLAAGCIVAIGAAQLASPRLQDLGWLLWLGVFWFIAAAFRPFWFFLGLERVRAVLAVEVAGKVTAVVAVIWLVNSPADAWLVFALQGAASVVSGTVATVMVYRIVPFMAPTVGDSIRQLREGLGLFVFRMSTSIYNLSNVVILGFVAPAVVVGYYAGAERISRVLTTMMIPAVQSMFPRSSHLAKNDAEAAARVARIATVTLFTLASIGAVVLFFASPLLIRVLLGPAYSETIPVLRVLLLLLPILGISIPLGMQWMIPLGLEGILTRITVAGGLFHVPLATFLGMQYQHVGIAWALVTTESLILASTVGFLLLRRIAPIGGNRSEIENVTGAIQ